MSEALPRRNNATVLANMYACVNQIACSASAFKAAATCGRPTITILELMPNISIPIVVTVRTVHLYFRKIAPVALK
ncbi:MAG: hypothetical protein QXT02_05645 [Candidatus Hadarchaeum sp.]